MILHLTLHKKWFDQILVGEKTIEYRDIKLYWTKRLFDATGTAKPFTEVFFKNGYNKDARWMKVECKGVRKGEKRYEIMLGKILEVKS